jgi:hypothetical protein
VWAKSEPLNRFTILDVNYFPSFSGVHEFPDLILDLIEHQVDSSIGAEIPIDTMHLPWRS